MSDASRTVALDNEQGKRAAKKERTSFADSVRSFVAEWSVTILMLLFGTTTLVQAFVVPTGSMENTVLIGDHVFVDKLAYSPAGGVSKYVLPYRDVKRGDIVVFRYPMNIRENYVKRVIGTPGDRIKIVDKQLYINGNRVEEPYKIHSRDFSVPYLDNFPARPDFPVYEPALRMIENNVVNAELLVPPASFFVMGDNRDNSADSRYWGFVPRENIVGKPVIIWWSYDAPTARLADPNIISFDHIVDLAQNFFTKTRWRRTFMLVRGHPF